MGEIVTDLLVDHFGSLVDLEFTARMEDDLDEVASGKRAWVPLVRDFYTPVRGNGRSQAEGAPAGRHRAGHDRALLARATRW